MAIKETRFNEFWPHALLTALSLPFWNHWSSDPLCMYDIFALVFLSWLYMFAETLAEANTAFKTVFNEQQTVICLYLSYCLKLALLFLFYYCLFTYCKYFFLALG